MPTALTWLGHGTWLLESGRHKVLLDPFLADNPAAPVKAEQVQADYLLISHGHFDHVADAAEIAKRCGATVVAIYEICDWLGKKFGVEKAEPMNLGGAVNLPFGRVKLTPAFHSSTLPDGAPGGNPGGFLITLPEGRIYFACDTGLFSDMKLHAGGVDIAVLPIGDRFTMGPDDALEAVKLIQPKRVIPSHFNTWPPIEQNAGAWAERVRRETAAEPIVLEPGGKFTW
jgi:L-ascorbate metabolism protein UlaG (beta-lactamase superfamily)